MDVNSKHCTVSLATERDIPNLETLWTSLYSKQEEWGMTVQIPPNGFSLWCQSILAGLNRYTVVCLASNSTGIHGFAAGRLRSLPPYFGGTQVGLVSDVFVDPTYRRLGIGEDLLKSIRGWFSSHSIERLELQVFGNNPTAREFYRSQGWKDELFQMVWLPQPT